MLPEPIKEITVKEALAELMQEFESRRDQTFFGFEVVGELQEYLDRIKSNG